MTASDKTEVFENALSSARSEVQGMQADLRLLASGFENTFELTLSDSLGAAEERLSAARQRFRRPIRREWKHQNPSSSSR